jgi:uncharacterized membrane protein
MTKVRILLALTVILLTAALLVGPAGAAEKKDKPARGLVAAMAYPGITLGTDESIRVDLIVKNLGRSNETVMLKVAQQPKGWKAEIKNFGTVVDGIFVSEDDSKTLTFSAEPMGESKKLPAGKYRFAVLAATPDGFYKNTTTLDVTVLEGKKAEDAIKLTTSYPVLRGPSDAKFEFSLEVNNASEKDAVFNLAAVAPEGWEVSFKPAYEDKQISSLRIKANQNQSVGVAVTPSRQTEAGEYPVKVKVSSGKAKAEADLKVVLTGTFKIKALTTSGLLSVATQGGQPANMSLYVRNEGSALQKEIKFLSFKPENWKVEFKPEKVLNLKAGEVKQVEMNIIPSEDALVGDYSVGVNVEGEKSNSSLEIRTTVKASSAWGWIGIFIILLVIVGLAVTFKRLGRR